MSIRHIKVNGRRVWQARVAYAGRRMSTIRPTRAEAREAEADLLRDLTAQRGQADTEAARPATLRQLLTFYAEDLAARGKH